MTGPEGIPAPLTLSEMASLAASFPPPRPQAVLYVSDIAERAVLEMMIPSGRPSLASFLFGIPVVRDEDLRPGAWELRAGVEVIDGGVIQPAQPTVTARQEGSQA